MCLTFKIFNIAFLIEIVYNAMYFIYIIKVSYKKDYMKWLVKY